MTEKKKDPSAMKLGAKGGRANSPAQQAHRLRVAALMTKKRMEKRKISLAQ